MKLLQTRKINTITEYHQYMDLPKPAHPLISLVNFESIKRLPDSKLGNLVVNFYSIALKRNFNGKMKYGQQEYDFKNGLMTFLAPGQTIRIEYNSTEELKHSGWLLIIHPDFLLNTPLIKTIRQYKYFGYSVHEALHLSAEEEATITVTMQNIEREYCSNTDAFSQPVMIAQIELLLAYADRFYHRQFITRCQSNHKILNRLEDLLTAYFGSEAVEKQGVPTVKYIAETLNVSPNYLSVLLKILTGQSTQQHIHDKLIEKAKEKLSSTDLSISEIAYELGFEHSQSFSKLFKSKTNTSPVEFRLSFN